LQKIKEQKQLQDSSERRSAIIQASLTFRGVDYDDDTVAEIERDMKQAMKDKSGHLYEYLGANKATKKALSSAVANYCSSKGITEKKLKRKRASDNTPHKRAKQTN
jgi:formaldehyde-activating enzyme involved in methanogenesis